MYSRTRSGKGDSADFRLMLHKQRPRPLPRRPALARKIRSSLYHPYTFRLVHGEFVAAAKPMTIDSHIGPMNNVGSCRQLRNARISVFGSLGFGLEASESTDFPFSSVSWMELNLGSTASENVIEIELGAGQWSRARVSLPLGERAPLPTERLQA
jgi:hypothetical protein